MIVSNFTGILYLTLMSIVNDIQQRRKIKKNSREIVSYLSETLGERTLQRYENLNTARLYIMDYFQQYDYPVHEEIYTVQGKDVSNIILDIRGSEEPGTIILVGAHYDTVENTPGADDNATAIAALLELLRLVAGKSFKKTLRLAAFTLEEPPFFKTDLMGSMRYASHCRERNDNIEFMVAFDMLGFTAKKAERGIPHNGIQQAFPERGNFLTVVTLPSSAEYAYLWKRIYNKQSRHCIFDVVGPASVPGLDMSDHISFIQNGFPAVLITDTAFYRNKHYHAPTDTVDTINFTFLSDNILNITSTIEELLNM